MRTLLRAIWSMKPAYDETRSSNVEKCGSKFLTARPISTPAARVLAEKCNKVLPRCGPCSSNVPTTLSLDLAVAVSVYITLYLVP
jgi:hypothetical protein